jgi:hypothetical protein
MRKNVQVGRSTTTETVSFQQNHKQKTSNLDVFEGAMEKKTALEIASDTVEQPQEGLLELGKWVGRGQAFGMIAAKASAAEAQCLKRIKEGGEYKALELTWEQFCVTQIGISRQTADRIIDCLEEFGAAYFTLSSVTRISPGTYRMIAGAVSDSTIEIEGERVPITKTNAGRIAEAISSLRQTVEEKDAQIAKQAEKEKALTAEKRNATKAAERERLALVEYKRQQTERFAGAGEDHCTMLDAQSHFDLAMAKLASVGAKELSTEDEARLIGLGEYMYRALIQATHDARERMGKGWNMAAPGDLLGLDDVTGDARNLVDEFTKGKK